MPSLGGWTINRTSCELSGMIDILERTVQRHHSTTFVTCHFANLSYDLDRLGEILERHPNLYADIAARYAETAPIPRFVSQFYAKHADRLVYGTDMGFDKRMYEVTFRVLESIGRAFLRKRHVRIPLEPERFRASGRNIAEGISHHRREDSHRKASMKFLTFIDAVSYRLAAHLPSKHFLLCRHNRE